MKKRAWGPIHQALTPRKDYVFKSEDQRVINDHQSNCCRLSSIALSKNLNGCKYGPVGFLGKISYSEIDNQRDGV